VRRRAAAFVAVAAVAATAGAGASAAPPAPIVHGYPYGDRCPAAGIADVVDRWGMYACNCTSYVAWALVANGERIDWFVPGAMNAWNWPHVARLAGLRVDTTPSVGSVAAWPRLAPPFGHVAYVIRVDSPRSIDVAEYNYPLFGVINTYVFGTRSSVSTRGAVFIHVPRRRSAAPRQEPQDRR
jgi:surface antigen